MGNIYIVEVGKSVLDEQSIPAGIELHIDTFVTVKRKDRPRSAPLFTLQCLLADLI